MKITVNTRLNIDLVWSPFTSRADWILGYITQLALLGENIIAFFRVLLNLPLEYWFETPAVQNECWETIKKPSKSYWDCQSDSAHVLLERGWRQTLLKMQQGETGTNCDWRGSDWKWGKAFYNEEGSVILEEITLL